MRPQVLDDLWTSRAYCEQCKLLPANNTMKDGHATILQLYVALNNCEQQL